MTRPLLRCIYPVCRYTSLRIAQASPPIHMRGTHTSPPPIPMRGTHSRQRNSNVAVSSGRPNDDSTTGTTDDKKYDKRRKRLAEKRAQYVGIGICFVTLFWLGRYLAFGRRDRQIRYERAEAMLRNAHLSNRLHQGRRKNPQHPVVDPDDNDDANDADADADYDKAANKEPGSTFTTHDLAQKFQRLRTDASSSTTNEILKDWMRQLNQEIRDNVHGGIRWIPPYLLPGSSANPHQEAKNGKAAGKQGARFFHTIKRRSHRMTWEDEYDELLEQNNGVLPGPPVDYTNRTKYRYPDLLSEPPPGGGYPKLTSLGDMMAAWDQDEDNPDVITETLLHFDFTKPEEMIMATKFRDAMLPFKLTNVPELQKAQELWTDEYVGQAFAERAADNRNMGSCQESPNHYFAFFGSQRWNEDTMGLPPYQINDWDYETWAKHARYADAKPLAEDQPHFYWQAGVSPQERYSSRDEWSFVSRDLPSFSATESNFIMFHPEKQKGIQCRFGERGVVAATHYDGGRNMVGMIHGAKRYILSPPTACGRLGIFPQHDSSIYRHSLLDFGHIKYLNDVGKNQGMSAEERSWLERAATAPAVETVLKAGEILYIPSYWFHYIVSIQKSAQCNARSGAEADRQKEFGGLEDVTLPMCQPGDSVV